MKQGKRCIRNTVLALFGISVLVTAAERVYVAVVDEHTPQWLRSVMSLGLAVTDRRDVVARTANPQVVDLGDARSSIRSVSRGISPCKSSVPPSTESL